MWLLGVLQKKVSLKIHKEIPVLKSLPDTIKELQACNFIEETLPLWSEATTRGVLWKKVFLEISQNSQEDTCARVSFLINLQAPACNLIKKETLAEVFSCKFPKFLRTTFSQNTSGRLLLCGVSKPAV